MNSAQTEIPDPACSASGWGVTSGDPALFSEAEICRSKVNICQQAGMLKGKPLRPPFDTRDRPEERFEGRPSMTGPTELIACTNTLMSQLDMGADITASPGMARFVRHWDLSRASAATVCGGTRDE